MTLWFAAKGARYQISQVDRPLEKTKYLLLCPSFQILVTTLRREHLKQTWQLLYLRWRRIIVIPTSLSTVSNRVGGRHCLRGGHGEALLGSIQRLGLSASPCLFGFSEFF